MAVSQAIVSDFNALLALRENATKIKLSHICQWTSPSIGTPGL
jgi:hypothetical protein